MLKFIVHSSIKKYYLNNFRHHNYYNSHDDNRNFLIKFTKFHDHSQHSLSFSLFHFVFCFCSISLLHLCNPQSRKLEMNGCFWSNCFSNRTIKLSISEEFLDLRRLSKSLCSSCYLNTQLFAVRIADKGGINGENNSSRLEFRLHTFLFFSLSPYIYISPTVTTFPFISPARESLRRCPAMTTIAYFAIGRAECMSSAACFGGAELIYAGTLREEGARSRRGVRVYPDVCGM